MKKYKIISGPTTHYVQARGLLEARAEFRKTNDGSVDYIIRVVENKAKALVQEAAAQCVIKVGVQRSMQLGYSDLPLFFEDKQTKLFE
jgi:uncharacterized protein YukJ